jgi:asparagine synthase (glutamine-hydrolysing)
MRFRFRANDGGFDADEYSIICGVDGRDTNGVEHALSSAEKRLIGLRDPMGGYPLFWTQQRETVGLNTSLWPLLELLPGQAMNLDYLAEFLMLTGCGVPELPDERCAFEGIQRLLAGTMIEVGIPGGRIRKHVYWNWLERMVDPGNGRLEEIGARYGELLRRAVRERLCGRTAAYCSGGQGWDQELAHDRSR